MAAGVSPPASRARAPAATVSQWTLAVRALRSWLTNYRRTWRGTIYSSVLNPLLYLGAMGLGLGTLVNAHGQARLGGVSYLEFLAPGLLAAGSHADGRGRVHLPDYGVDQVAEDLPGRCRVAAAPGRPLPRAPAVHHVAADHELRRSSWP